MAVLVTDFQFEFEPAFPVIEDNNEFDEFAQEMAGTHKNYNNDVSTMIRVLGEECRIFPPAPDTDLGLLTNTLGYMQEGFPHIYTFGPDEDEDDEDYEEDDEDYEEEDPNNRYEVEVPYMNNSGAPEEVPNNEEYDEYEDENLNPDMFEDEDEDDEDYSSDEDI